MIKTTDLSFAYDGKPELFKGINLDLYAGRIYGLLGRNGVGKTTLLRLLAGLLFPKQGSCIVNGFMPKLRLPNFLQEIYFLPEECYLPPLRIDKYLELYAPFYPRFNRDLFWSYIHELDLSAYDNLQNLSYGQKKKAVLAFALATDCKCLFLDEPSNGLDIPSKSKLRKLLAATLTEEKTIIISTHQVRDLESLIDSIIILDNGKILLQQPIEKISQCLLFTSIEEVRPEQIIYSEKVFGNPNKVVALNRADNESAIDLELLFNAVLVENEKINSLFN